MELPRLRWRRHGHDDANVDKRAEPVTRWRKSSHSGGANECIEVAEVGRLVVALRDSKNPTGPCLKFSRAAWKSFCQSIKEGRFDHLR